MMSSGSSGPASLTAMPEAKTEVTGLLEGHQ